MQTRRLRAVFMGAPEFAVPALEALHAHHDVRLVVTQPDRPRGRGRRLAPPPVKEAAARLGLPCFQPEKLRNHAAREQIGACAPEVIVVAAYGKILSPRLLAVPPLGCVNVHASLLPALRGAAPIQWAVIRGEARSGITIMQMDEGMDTGPILLQQGFDLAADETAGSLHDRLAPLGARLLTEALQGLLAGTLRPTAQDHGRASLAPLLTKEDGRVDLTRPAREVDLRVRGLDPWPGAFTTLGDQPLKLFCSRVEPGGEGRPGEVLGVDRRGLLLACGQGSLRVAELQLPGRRRMPAGALLAGHPIPPGTVLGR